MAKVTSKLQVTIPKALARKAGIRPGDDIEWEQAEEVLRIRPAARGIPLLSTEEKLRLFDEQTSRQSLRRESSENAGSEDRGWSREELYDRDPPR